EILQRLDELAVKADLIQSEPSAELIRVIRAWCVGLSRPPPGPTGSGIRSEGLRYDANVGVHRLLHMVTAYLWDDDAEVLRLTNVLRGNPVIQSNPLHASFYALFTILSATRARHRLSSRRLHALVHRLEQFEAIRPPNFRSMLALARAEVA